MVSPDELKSRISNTTSNLALNLSDNQRLFLWRVLQYYNAVPTTIADSDTKCYLGRDRPPSPRALMAATYDEMDTITEMLAELHELGILDPDPVYICRTEVSYCPTERGRMVLDSLFSDIWPEVYDSTHALEEISTESVLRGEQNESLLHRYGVYKFADVFAQESVTLYPTDSDARPDVLIDRRDARPLTGEMQTGHNDYQQIVDKYEALAAQESEDHWVFHDAPLAARTINLLQDRADRFDCVNAPFANPNNYRPNRLNEYLNRDTSRTPGMARVWTLSQLHNEHHDGSV